MRTLLPALASLMFVFALTACPGPVIDPEICDTVPESEAFSGLTDVKVNINRHDGFAVTPAGRIGILYSLSSDPSAVSLRIWDGQTWYSVPLSPEGLVTSATLNKGVTTHGEKFEVALAYSDGIERASYHILVENDAQDGFTEDPTSTALPQTAGTNLVRAMSEPMLDTSMYLFKDSAGSSYLVEKSEDELLRSSLIEGAELTGELGSPLIAGYHQDLTPWVVFANGSGGDSWVRTVKREGASWKAAATLFRFYDARGSDFRAISTGLSAGADAKYAVSWTTEDFERGPAPFSLAIRQFSSETHAVLSYTGFASRQASRTHQFAGVYSEDGLNLDYFVRNSPDRTARRGQWTVESNDYVDLGSYHPELEVQTPPRALHACERLLVLQQNQAVGAPGIALPTIEEL